LRFLRLESVADCRGWTSGNTPCAANRKTWPRETPQSSCTPLSSTAGPVPRKGVFQAPQISGPSAGPTAVPSVRFHRFEPGSIELALYPLVPLDPDQFLLDQTFLPQAKAHVGAVQA